MTPMGPTTREFDLQPHPRILPMLGEINLSQWRCLAELVDNAIDAFLVAKREGQPVPDPRVQVILPLSDVPGAMIVVRDNGPGMDPATLENAVRAGWTGNDPIGNLGLFGMGFNIATARLGMLTRVWSTRAGDPEWYGLEIDFEALQRQRHFRTPMITKPKSDPAESGTEIYVERMKLDQRQWFAKAANRSKIANELGRIYSTMLRPNGDPIEFRLLMNNGAVRGRQHCVWGGENSPPRETRSNKYGTVSAYQPIDVRLPPRPFCLRCWHWLAAEERDCPACGSGDEIIERQRAIRGWLGIQRYLSANDYGIDFLRNGRKIELANRDLYFWNGDEAPELEYPIDDPRGRGRIVGEIHLDHCRVTYTKDRFDRNDPAWEDMVKVVRGEGPLRPDKAAELGYQANTAPLFLLFQIFRRSSPRSKTAGAYADLLIVPDNERAEEMAKRFHAGDAAYQTDAKWWELVEEADRRLLTTSPASGASGGAGLAGFGVGAGGNQAGQAGTSAATGPGASTATAGSTTTPPPVPTPNRTAIPSLTREYRDDTTSQRWDVRAFEAEPTDPELVNGDLAWRLRGTTSGTFEFYVNPRHPVFLSATLTPLDALLADLTHIALDFDRGRRGTATFAGVLTSLREQFAGETRLDPVALLARAASVLDSMAHSLVRNVDGEDSRALFDELPLPDREAILRTAAQTVAEPMRVPTDGQFLRYAPKRTLLTFFERHPELFLDGRHWDTIYASLDVGIPELTEELRAKRVYDYVAWLSDATWLVEQQLGVLERTSRTRLLRASLALDLLEENAVDGSEA